MKNKLVMLLLMVLLVVSMAGCGETCTSCGKTITGTVYGDLTDSEAQLCKSCAESYYEGLNIENFHYDRMYSK